MGKKVLSSYFTECKDIFICDIMKLKVFVDHLDNQTVHQQIILNV